jgi:hypothetical protein
MRNCCAVPLFLHKKNAFIGIHLPADFTAEHEWGIEKIKLSFGIPDVETTKPPFGIERYKATIAPEAIVQEKDDRIALAVIYRPWREVNLFEYSELKGRLYDESDKRNKADKSSEFETYDIKARGAWDGDDFGIIAEGEKAKNLLTTLHEAIKAKDVIAFLGGGSFLQNGGLNIAIASAVPKKLQKDLAETHKKTADLYNKAQATGIYEKVPQKMYYALTPNWDKDGTVRFWLNPTEQQSNNFGYYTVKELEQWMQGKGPIPKSNSSK